MIKKIRCGFDDSSEETLRRLELCKEWATRNGFVLEFVSADSMFVDLDRKQIYFHQVVTDSPEDEWPEGVWIKSVAQDSWRSPGVDLAGREIVVARTVPLLVDPPTEITEGGE